ncbi:MAG: 3-dehydroquinate synthase [Crocinitomicaceae bacterium]|nr:3-dehydroquinate synthase [Crocinitomicaceae bacterium]|tara:strand:- start:1450 stop:2514 length:1065 start_codon:yes stop_codon:yes gene_type:complete
MNSVRSTSWRKELKSHIREKSLVFLLADSNLPDSYSMDIMKVCKIKNKTHLLKIKGGEQIKTHQHLIKIYNELDVVGADRKSVLICLGGGTISDLGGFAASTYKRGIDLVILPTTVVGMVDAAIGGKNGINLESNVGILKNQIGTFHQPKLTGIDFKWLDSLPQDEIKSGWGEMLKHALLKGGSHLEQLKNAEPNIASLAPLIIESGNIKEGIVRRDVKENGERVLLNLGHTVGHAIESLELDASTESEIKHGIAVAWGIVFTLEVSVIKMGFNDAMAKELIKWIVDIIGYREKMWGSKEIWLKMCKDKKNINGNVKDVLLRNPGDVDWSFTWEREEFTILWEQFRKRYELTSC